MTIDDIKTDYIYVNKMKKSILIAILIVLSMVPLFAASGWFGFTAASDFNWSRLNDVEDSTVNIYGHDLLINIDGATYFGTKHQFGLGYGIGLGIPLYTEANGEMQYNKPVSFIPKLSFQYKYIINHLLSIEAGLGLNYGIQNFVNLNHDIEKIKVLNLFANTNVMVHLTGLICFRAGVGITSPIYGNFVEDSTYEKRHLNVLGISIQPYLGISFCY